MFRLELNLLKVHDILLIMEEAVGGSEPGHVEKSWPPSTVRKAA